MKNLLAIAAIGGLLTATAVGKDFPKGSPDFKTDYDEAMAVSEKSGKPMLVVFSASWCPPCQANKKNVYPSDAVKPFHDKFVWVYLDTDEEKNGAAAKKFGVRGIPHIQFVASDGKSLDQAVGGSNPQRFAEQLEAVLKKAGA